MTTTARERAEAEQRTASDPAVSAFVGASAGSGKTKLLTDRLLRLMLGGADPARIVCLTFTRAAAAEMALRLQRRLGRWVTAPEDQLDRDLGSLGLDPSPDLREKARGLFALVLDLPGGMRIGTIHAFCQSLLRRFPLEAALSPHFRLVEDPDAQALMREAREAMLADAVGERREALARLAGLVSVESFGHLVRTLREHPERLTAALDLGEALEAAQRRVLGVGAADEHQVIEAAVVWNDSPIAAAARVVAREGSRACADKAGRFLAWLELGANERAEMWADWREEFLTAAGTGRACKCFVNERLSACRPELVLVFEGEVERVGEVEDECRAVRMAGISAALVRLARPVLDAYGKRKEGAGWLDYDDLIGLTSGLLVDPGAAWVLYKLDGGLDHLLLDEVQDTSPAQWRIAHALSAEFFVGDGGREAKRTVFAVGDRKQSIYSFQGADIAEFDRSHGLLRDRVKGAGEAWCEAVLNVSFRSTAPVLALIDAVFASEQAAAGVVEPGRLLQHFAERAGHAGMVELWPLAPVPDTAVREPWSVAERNARETSAPETLAERLAEWIRAETAGGVLLESRGRPLAPGDVMVLVRRRGDFARCLVRQLKARGVPVAGLDRLVLTEQPAVQDLLALCDALLLPGDDLTLATVMTSPLGGLDDDDLMALAVERQGSLWEALTERAGERPAWGQAHHLISSLLARVDYTTPHALLSEALGPLGGRARLYARLGPEAAEPVDELLSAALAYARNHPPSLQGFVHWLRQSGAEVKREAEGASGVVRVMTVHGAKGLQAPLVILPDTTALPPDDGPILWGEDRQTRRLVPLWAPRKEFRCAAAARVRAEATARRIEEYNRLLYVGLTRAEDRLLVCGWQTRRPMPDGCWYRLVEAGFARLGAESVPFDAPEGPGDGGWGGSLLRYASPQIAVPEQAARSAQRLMAPLPPWAGSAPDWRAAPSPPEPPRAESLAPSRPEGVEYGPVPGSDLPLAVRDALGRRFVRGQLIHGLLQHLPALPPERWAAAAHAHLDRPGHGFEPEAVAKMVDQTLAILRHPELKELFGPGSRAEAPLAGTVGGAVVGGVVDRLAVLPDRVLVADFKTNRAPPASVDVAPPIYLRQMAAYRAVLGAIFPGRVVQCALVWTETAEVHVLADSVLQAYAPGDGVQGDVA